MQNILARLRTLVYGLLGEHPNLSDERWQEAVRDLTGIEHSLGEIVGGLEGQVNAAEYRARNYRVRLNQDYYAPENWEEIVEEQGLGPLAWIQNYADLYIAADEAGYWIAIPAYGGPNGAGKTLFEAVACHMALKLEAHDEFPCPTWAEHLLQPQKFQRTLEYNGTCPKCGSASTSGDGVHLNEDSGRAPCHCQKCGCDWDEIWGVTDIEVSND